MNIDVFSMPVVGLALIFLNQNFHTEVKICHIRWNLKSSENQHLSEKHMWFCFTCGVSHVIYNCKGIWEKKCLLYSTRDSGSYLSREATVCACVCVSVRACMHACLWMCASVSVWVCACKFSISPWATPTHSHVSHSNEWEGSSQAK